MTWWGLHSLLFDKVSLEKKTGYENTVYHHQLSRCTNRTNQLRASLDQNETDAMFVSSLVSSIMANQE